MTLPATAYREHTLGQTLCEVALVMACIIQGTGHLPWDTLSTWIRNRETGRDSNPELRKGALVNEALERDEDHRPVIEHDRCGPNVSL